MLSTIQKLLRDAREAGFTITEMRADNFDIIDDLSSLIKYQTTYLAGSTSKLYPVTLYGIKILSPEK